MSYKYTPTQELLDRKVLTYQEILNLKKRMTGYAATREIKKEDTGDPTISQPVVTAKHAEDYNWREEYNITPEHTQKGLDYLNRVVFKPSHYARHNWDMDCCLRANYPLGYRELEILRHFKRFTFAGFYDTTNQYQYSAGYRTYYPIWRCYAKNGDSFDYYLEAGTLNVCG